MMVLGLLSALGFAPLNLWIIALPALAIFIAMIDKCDNSKAAFARGWWFGLGHFLMGMNWIAMAFQFQSSMPYWIGWLAVFLLSLFLALYPALASWAAKYTHIKIGRDCFMSFAFFIAAFWVIFEWVRSWLFTGFAWNPLGVMAIELGFAARLIGSYGLSALVMLMAAAFVAIIVKKQWKQAGILASLPLLLTGISYWNLSADALHNSIADKSSVAQNRPIVQIIQPNVGQTQKYDPALMAQNVQKLLRLSRAHNNNIDPQNSNPTRLIFWPEAAIEFFLEDHYPARFYYPQDSGLQNRQAIISTLDENDLLITGGTKLHFDDKGQPISAANSVFVLNNRADILGSYDKSHLVPFGEYLPLSSLLEPLGISRLVPGDIYFKPASGADNISLGKHGLMGLQICYEVIFSGETVNDNARPDFIFNPSNDAWFGFIGPPQHLAQARLRALEEGLPVIRSTPTGISALINASGQIVNSIPHHEKGQITARLPYPFAPTFFAIWGLWSTLGFALLLLIFGLALGRRKR